MKKTTLAAILIAAASITFVSCDWFNSKKKDVSPSIVGSWKIDSMHIATKDTSISPFLYAIAVNKDSLGLQFNADSTFNELPKIGPSVQKFYTKEKELFIQEDSTYKIFDYKLKDDSTLVLQAKDSSLFILKRK
jgi:hypothetical protein